METEKITPKSKSQLAAEYGIHINTLRNWLIRCKFYEEKPNANKAKMFTISELTVIYDKLGRP